MPAFLRLPAGSMRMPASWWVKSALAGMCGGGAIWLFMALLDIANGVNGWHFVNMVGAIYPGWRPMPVGFVAGPTLSGIFTHLAVAAAIGLAYGFVVDVLPSLLSSLGMSIATGAIAGFWTWVVAGRTIGPVVSPGFRGMTGNDLLAWLVAHAVFGAITAAALYLLAERTELARVRVTMFPAERVSVAATRTTTTTTEVRGPMIE